MKTKIVNVPKFLVKSHYAHPEYYGESIVSLVNGMVTDVYSLDNGLITQTNDQKLIKYLKTSKCNIDLTLKNDYSRINEVYILELYVWLIKKFTKKELKIKKIKTFINHIQTAYSDIIVSSKNKVMLFYYTNNNILYYDYLSCKEDSSSRILENIISSLETKTYLEKKINLLDFIYMVNNYLFIDYDKIS